MRMRKKRNLEARLSECGELLLARGKPCENLKEAAETYRALIDFRAVFQNENSVCLEVGCGNGGFIAQMAQKRPDVNFLAAEVCSNVIVTAMERARRERLANVRFLNIAAEILPCYIAAESVSEIYLNFSTPLPEHSREKQRLTSPRFLKIYRALLKEGGLVIQKTDSVPFFDYSLQSFTENGFTVEEVTRDLLGSEWAKDNLVTEYERNFIAQGVPICRAAARKTGGKINER